MKHTQKTAGVGLPVIIGAIAILAVAGIATTQLLKSSPEAQTAQQQQTDLDTVRERAQETGELPTNPSPTEATVMAGDPILEEMDDADMAADGGAPALELPEIGDEVIVEAPVSDPLPLAAGTYEPYSPEKLALAETGEVVLFFHAPWCPSCRGLESDVEKNLSNIPDGVHILVVDYDSETALKKQYGIVRQHTLVQVNSNGAEIKKLTGLTNTLNQVVGQL